MAQISSHTHFNPSSFCFLGPIDRVTETRPFSRSPSSCLPHGCRDILRRLETVDALRTSKRVRPTLSSFAWFGSSGDSPADRSINMTHNACSRMEFMIAFGNVSSWKHCVTTTKNTSSLNESSIQCILPIRLIFPTKKVCKSDNRKYVCSRSRRPKGRTI